MASSSVAALTDEDMGFAPSTNGVNRGSLTDEDMGFAPSASSHVPSISFHDQPSSDEIAARQAEAPTVQPAPQKASERIMARLRGELPGMTPEIQAAMPPGREEKAANPNIAPDIAADVRNVGFGIPANQITQPERPRLNPAQMKEARSGHETLAAPMPNSIDALDRSGGMGVDYEPPQVVSNIQTLNPLNQTPTEWKVNPPDTPLGKVGEFGADLGRSVLARGVPAAAGTAVAGPLGTVAGTIGGGIVDNFNQGIQEQRAEDIIYKRPQRTLRQIATELYQDPAFMGNAEVGAAIDTMFGLGLSSSLSVPAKIATEGTIGIGAGGIQSGANAYAQGQPVLPAAERGAGQMGAMGVLMATGHAALPTHGGENPTGAGEFIPNPEFDPNVGPLPESGQPPAQPEGQPAPQAPPETTPQAAPVNPEPVVKQDLTAQNQNEGEQNASPIRSDQGQLRQVGETPTGSQETSGHDVQRESETGNRAGDKELGPTNPVESQAAPVPVQEEGKQPVKLRGNGDGKPGEEVPIGNEEALNPTAEAGGGEPPIPPAGDNLRTGEGEGEKPSTSIKNAVAAAERTEAGMEQRKLPPRESFQDVMDRVDQHFKDDPNIAHHVIDELKDDKNRMLSTEEVGILTHHKVTLRNARDAAEAVGDTVKAARIQDELNSLHDLTENAGTQNARALAFRRLMLADDYSIEELTRQKKAAVGRDLTTEESKKIADQANQIADLQRKLDASIAAHEDTRLQAEMDAKIAEMKLAARKPGALRGSEGFGKKVIDFATQQEEAARARLKERSKTLRSSASPIPPEDLVDYAVIGAAKLVRGAAKFADWSADMVKDFGESIRPYLRPIFEESLKKVAEARDFAAARIAPMPEESRLKSAKTRMSNRIAELEGQKASGKFLGPKKRESLKLDKDSMALKARLEQLKAEANQSLAEDRYKNRTKIEKGADITTRVGRATVLTYFSTLGKLTNAALSRMLLTPVEELTGAGIRGVMKGVGKIPGLREIGKIPDLAPRHGAGLNIRAEARAKADVITNFLKDFKSEIKTGKTDFETAFGEKSKFERPPAIDDFFGHVHSALKSPAMRDEFSRSLSQRLEWAANNGEDINSPEVQFKHSVGATADALDAVLRGDNRATDAYNSALRFLEAKDKITGKPHLGGKITATTARVVVPMVKIATNYVNQAFEYSGGGFAKAAPGIIRAIRNGAESLSPAEHDFIMRSLKRGAVGTAFLALGMAKPDMFGGYYQEGEKRGSDEAKAGGMRIAGYNIPRVFSHIPILEAAQIGATISRMIRKKNAAEGVKAAGIGLVKEIPFVGQGVETLQNMERKSVGQLGGAAVSRFIPGFVKEAAKVTDTEDGKFTGEPVKRRPDPKASEMDQFKQTIMMNIPGLRKMVPTPQKSGGGSGRSGRYERIRPKF